MLADGTYASQSAHGGAAEVLAPHIALARQVFFYFPKENLWIIIMILFISFHLFIDVEFPSPIPLLSSQFPLRSLVLAGDYFLACSVANCLVKLVLKTKKFDVKESIKNSIQVFFLFYFFILFYFPPFSLSPFPPSLLPPLPPQ